MADPPAQARLFDSEFATPAAEAAFKSYFTRERIGSEGRDPLQMRYVESMDVTAYSWERFRWVLTSLPTRGNFYVHSAMTGRYADPSSVPPYLLRENYARLRALAPRMRVEQVDVEGALRAEPRAAFSKANLSDLFEYLSDDAADSLFEILGERLRGGGRLCFWNLLVPREVRRTEGTARARFRPLRDLASRLHARDRAWLYSAFHIEEVSR